MKTTLLKSTFMETCDPFQSHYPWPDRTQTLSLSRWKKLSNLSNVTRTEFSKNKIDNSYIYPWQGNLVKYIRCNNNELHI